jgi:two-component system sensor histidine kinase HydH
VSDRLAVAPAAIIGGQLDDVLVGPAGEETGLLMQSAAQLGRATEFGVRSPRLGADLQVSVTPRTGTDGGAEGAILVARDVTAERRAERIRQQHLVVRRDEETLRTFRHELGNVLNTLQTTFSAFERHYEELSADKRLVYLQRCRESLDLAGHLHAALARYQKLERIDVAPLDLSGFLGEKATWLFERAEAAGCRCRFEPCSERTTVLADRQAVLRIVLNLIDNAVAAVAHGDEKSITLSCTASSDHGSLTVRDTGCGVPVQLADSVMTPLFTTKPTGSGMGLAIVQRLMDRMGGLVELSSETGRGTTVELRFPRLSERRGAPP